MSSPPRASPWRATRVESAAQAARAGVASGTPFATAASAAGGGPRGCGILYGVADQLPAGANLDDLPLNTVSQPLDDDGNYFLIEITKKTPSTFASARSAVEDAVQNVGADNARVTINAAERRAVVTVNPRYGRWVPLGPRSPRRPPRRPATCSTGRSTARSP